MSSRRAALALCALAAAVALPGASVAARAAGAPEVTGFYPDAGVRGSDVTIYGGVFTGATKVRFNGVPAVFSVLDGSTIDATVPPTATSGKVSVTTPDGTGTSFLPFRVVLPPTITSVSPTTVFLGRTVDVRGANLDFVTSATVGGVDAEITPVSQNRIGVTVFGGTGGKVRVTGPAGTALSGASVKVVPFISDFWPMEGPRGTEVSIHGTTLTGATAVKFNGRSAEFSVDDDATITATVPSQATTGKITVTTPRGSFTTRDAFWVLLPPTITGYDPPTGSAGSSLKVFGTNLDTVNEYAWGDGERWGGVNHYRPHGIPMPNKIGIYLPEHTREAFLTLFNPGGSVTSKTPYKIVVGIDDVTPSGGFAGTPVTITGWGFKGATRVAFGGTKAAFTVVGDETIHTTVPPNSAGGIQVTSHGRTDGIEFFAPGAPEIFNFARDRPIGGDVWVSGHSIEFSTGSINGIDVGPITWQDGEAHFTVPEGATTGLLTFTNRLGSATSRWPLIVGPSIKSYSPESGAPGSLVTIHGTSFTDAARLKLGTHITDFTVVDDSTIVAKVPNKLGSGQIELDTCTGEDKLRDADWVGGNFEVTSPSNNAVLLTPRFNCATAPKIDTATPNSGPPGTKLEILGTRFRGVTRIVFWNGTEDPSPVVHGNNHITAHVPAGATTGPWYFVNPGGKWLGGYFDVGYPPTVTSVSPASGPTGTTVTVTGTAFDRLYSVRFNDVPADWWDTFRVSSTQIRTVVPPTARTGPVTVTTTFGTSPAGSATFTVTDYFAQVLGL